MTDDRVNIEVRGEKREDLQVQMKDAMMLTCKDDLEHSF